MKTFEEIVNIAEKTDGVCNHFARHADHMNLGIRKEDYRKITKNSTSD